jgi:hypothetical protein
VRAVVGSVTALSHKNLPGMSVAKRRCGFKCGGELLQGSSHTASAASSLRTLVEDT